MTFGEIQADLWRRTGYATTPDARVVERLAAFCNEAQDAILAEPGMASLLYGTLTVDSVASRARYGISSVAQVRSITETDNDQKLHARSLNWYRTANPDPASNEGTPDSYVPLGIVAVQQVPAITGTGLWAVSSDAADTIAVHVSGIRLGGYPHTIAATDLTGTTRVALGTLTDYIDVTDCKLRKVCVGDVSLYDAVTSGNLLAVIPRGQLESRYWGFLLHPTPSAATTYVCDVEHEVVKLVHATDVPLLPPRFHRLVAIKARMSEYEFLGSEKYAVAETEYVRELGKLRASLLPPDYVMVPGGGPTHEGSNLGPWFPAGRWS